MNGPRPRLPSTSSSAPDEASTRTFAARPTITLERTSAGAPIALTESASVLRAVFRLPMCGSGISPKVAGSGQAITASTTAPVSSA